MNAKNIFLGLGGAGRNILNLLIDCGIPSTETLYADTDINVVPASKSNMFIRLGGELLRGRGTGAKPLLGLEAARASSDEIIGAVKNAQTLFLIAGLGGGVGSGSIACIAEITKPYVEKIVAVVTVPAKYEGDKRNNNAKQALDDLRSVMDGTNVYVIEHVDTVCASIDISDKAVCDTVMTLQKTL